MKRFTILIIFIICSILTFTACLSNNQSSEQAKVLSLQIENAKTEFELGEDFSFSGIIVYSIDKEGKKLKLENDKYEIDFSKFNKEEVGTYKIIVKLVNSEVFQEYEVIVIDKEDESKWSNDLWI